MIIHLEWVVRAHGNGVRVTPVGTFEVDERGRSFSEAPSLYHLV